MNHACPKCASERIVAAPEEAPGWSKQWTKCFACGKRWDLVMAPPKESADDSEEKSMSTSSDRQCVFITIHGTRCSQAATRGFNCCRPHIGKISNPAKEPMKKEPTETLPATRPAASIRLADPVMLNQVPIPTPTRERGQVSFVAIDAMIQRAEDEMKSAAEDLAALKRVRVMVERES